MTRHITFARFAEPDLVKEQDPNYSFYIDDERMEEDFETHYEALRAMFNYISGMSHPFFKSWNSATVRKYNEQDEHWDIEYEIEGSGEI